MAKKEFQAEGCGHFHFVAGKKRLFYSTRFNIFNFEVIQNFFPV